MLWQGAEGYTIAFGGSSGPWSHSGHQSVAKSFAYENRSILGANGDIEVVRAFPPVFTTGGAPAIDNQARECNRVDAMYLRLKTVSLSYDLNKKFVDQLGLTSVQIYVAGSNLLTFDNLGVYSGSYDHEIVSGSAGSQAADADLVGPLADGGGVLRTYGHFYPSIGTIVLSETALSTSMNGDGTGSADSGSAFDDVNWGLAANATTADASANNKMKLLKGFLSGSLIMRSEQDLNQTTYYCRMYHNEFDL